MKYKLELFWFLFNFSFASSTIHANVFLFRILSRVRSPKKALVFENELDYYCYVFEIYIFEKDCEVVKYRRLCKKLKVRLTNATMNMNMNCNNLNNTNS